MGESQVAESPREDLMFRVARTPDPSWFWKSGGASIKNIGTVLSITGTAFADCAPALEFGCGGGPCCA